jgi:hypothetical protein
MATYLKDVKEGFPNRDAASCSGVFADYSIRSRRFMPAAHFKPTSHRDDVGHLTANLEDRKDRLRNGGGGCLNVTTLGNFARRRVCPHSLHARQLDFQVTTDHRRIRKIQVVPAEWISLKQHMQHPDPILLEPRAANTPWGAKIAPGNTLARLGKHPPRPKKE